MGNPYELARRAADELRTASGVATYDVGVVLGSGWREGAAALGPSASVVATSTLSGFEAPTVEGHEGQILSLEFAGRRVALLSGRVHLYEGHDSAAVVHPVRTLVSAGARVVVLTNAAGGIDLDVAPGSVVVIRDHINLTSTSPLEGAPPPDGYGSRFVDLSDLYSARLRTLVHGAVAGLTEGVYVGVRGPHYETSAEVAAARTLGGTLVGMSTVLEAIAARHLGAEVLGLSLVSNYAAGVTPGPLNHADVLRAGASASSSLATLLTRVLAAL